MNKSFQFFSVVLLVGGALLVSACHKDDEEVTPLPATPSLVFKFKFDSTQVRLNNVGAPSTIPSGNAAQSPKFKYISQHYIELANDGNAVGAGLVLYRAPETNVGGANAIDYSKSIQSEEGAIFFAKPLKDIAPGSYKWLRVSLADQFYDITYKSSALPGNHLGIGTVASFIGFKTYLTEYKINGNSHVPSSGTGGAGNHDQGYWGFETNVSGTPYWIDGQSPAGVTTVPNPFVSSPLPAGSCLVTGQFVNSSNANAPLVITGSETTDIVITVSLSTNHSFEWHEITADNRYEPSIGENVVDMGIRGLKPIKN